MCGVTPSCHCAVSSLKYHEGTLYNTIQGCAQDLIIYLNSYEPTQQTIHAIMVMQQPDTQDPSNYQGEEMEKKGSFDGFAASQMGTVDCFCICTVL